MQLGNDLAVLESLLSKGDARAPALHDSQARRAGLQGAVNRPIISVYIFGALRGQI